MCICPRNVLKRNRQSSVHSLVFNYSNSCAVGLHRSDSNCVICIYLHNTGGIIPLQPDPVFARKPHSNSLLGAHFCDIATRGISGVQAQHTLLAICLPLLPDFPVR